MLLGLQDTYPFCAFFYCIISFNFIIFIKSCNLDIYLGFFSNGKKNSKRLNNLPEVTDI